MYRLRKLSIAVGVFAVLVSSTSTEAGIFRRCRVSSCHHRSCQTCSESPKVNQTCLAAHMAHHDGFCDYYALLCPPGSPTMWQGPHTDVLGGCNSAACFSSYERRGQDIQETGYRRSGSLTELLEWEAAPAFDNTAMRFVDPRSVTLEYITYKTELNNNTVFAQVINFRFTIDGGRTFEPFSVAFQIKERAAEHPVDKGRATKVKQHAHKFMGEKYEVLTHRSTVD